MWRALLTLLLFPLLTGCATTGVRPGSLALPRDDGIASYVSSAYDGHRTASGAIYDERRLTAAHPSLPFGTRVRVTSRENGRSVVVTITDRGPYHSGRIIDVSKRAAIELGFLGEGTAHVHLDVLHD